MRERDVLTYFRPPKRGLKALLKTVSRNLYYSWVVKHDKPERNEKRKYHVSLCVMFKDEAPYLREWLEYHMLVGVDHFYLYDNNSSDGFESIISSYQKEGLVTLVRWPHEHSQVKGYEDCITRFQGESDWIGFIDVDEFLVPVAEESLVTFLDRFSRRPAVLVYWRYFGSGGMLTRDTSRLVTEDFVIASEKMFTKGKCFFNSNYDYLFDPVRNRSMFHYLWTVSGGKAVTPVDVFDHTTYRDWYPNRRVKRIPLQINHYTVKSLAEFREKNKKGDVYYDHPTHGDNVFHDRDNKCHVPDYHIFRYMDKLKLKLAEREAKD